MELLLGTVASVLGAALVGFIVAWWKDRALVKNIASHAHRTEEMVNHLHAELCPQHQEKIVNQAEKISNRKQRRKRNRN